MSNDSDPIPAPLCPVCQSNCCYHCHQCHQDLSAKDHNPTCAHFIPTILDPKITARLLYLRDALKSYVEDHDDLEATQAKPCVDPEHTPTGGWKCGCKLCLVARPLLNPEPSPE